MIMPFDSTETQVQTIVTPKETAHYRIITDDPDNWHLVTSKPISQGELIAPKGTTLYVDVFDIEFVDIILEETQEQKRIYTTKHAVPGDSGCAPTTLEIPWCLMNHSCEANSRDQWCAETPAELEFSETRATRDIAEGEEFTYDYVLEQYDYRSPFECLCGAESCRGAISGFGGLHSDEQAQLLSSASPYVQEKYRRQSALKNIDVSPLGRHLLADYWDCDTALLNDEAGLIQILTHAAQAAGATVISSHSHRFEPEGVTAVVILAESHMSIHTWPGNLYAGVDFYTCGECDPLQAHKVISEALAVGRVKLLELERGRDDSPSSMAVVPGGLSNKAPLRSGLEHDGTWFLEGRVPGRRHSNINHGFSISELVLNIQTQFQECLIFDNPVYGRVLVLDEIVQLSTSDEHIYHDMLIHPPMFTHPNPQRVVIVGGGDGGTLREVLKHNPQQVVMIDIDERFVRLAEKHLPSLSNGSFKDPRVTLLFEDASEALLRYENSFDVAIIDCNDAIGPSEVLFEENFYETVARSLKNDGVCSVQAGSMLDVDFLQQTRVRMEPHLGSATGFRLTMPSYHCGEYVFLMAAKTCPPSGPDHALLADRQQQRGIMTKYWSPSIHHASQILPAGSTLW